MESKARHEKKESESIVDHKAAFGKVVKGCDISTYNLILYFEDGSKLDISAKFDFKLKAMYYHNPPTNDSIDIMMD